MTAVDTLSDAISSPKQHPVLSDYERTRALNIEKNNARLRALGLISAVEERKSNATAWGREDPAFDKQNDDEGEEDDENSSSDEEYNEGEDTVAKMMKKKRVRSADPPREGSRKSRRLMKLPSEMMGNDNTPNESETERKERIQQERKALVEECREARQRAALEVAKAGVEVASRDNPTATYEHCLMRVRSMTEKGLINRVRAIERAAGKHCVVKMAIFKSCLQDENMWELAELASDALERLKGLLPPPPK